MSMILSGLIFLTFSFFGFYVFSLFGKHPLAAEANLEEVTRQNDKGPAAKSIRFKENRKMSGIPFLERLLIRIGPVQNVQVWLKQAALPVSPGAFVLFSLVLGSLTAVLLLATGSGGFAWPILAACFVTVLPFVAVHLKRRSRIKHFSASFPDAVGRLASSLRAGYSMQIALENVVHNFSNLVSREFQYVLEHMGVGVSFEDALAEMLQRIDTSDLRLFIVSVLIQRESGGNLAEMLDNLEHSIRERQQLRRELDAASAQGRLSGLILSLLPVFVGLFVYFVHREYLMFFFEDSLGKKLFWACLAGQMMGMLCIRKIVRIDN